MFQKKLSIKSRLIVLIITTSISSFSLTVPAKAEYKPYCVARETPIWQNYNWDRARKVQSTVKFKFYDPSGCVESGKVLFQGLNHLVDLPLSLSRENGFTYLEGAWIPKEKKYDMILSTDINLFNDNYGGRFMWKTKWGTEEVKFVNPNQADLDAEKKRLENATPAEVFLSCEEMWNKYEGGVARTKTSKNYKTGSKKIAKSKFKPKVSKKNYDANVLLDTDLDKIACER